MEGKNCWLPDEVQGYALGRIIKVRDGIASCEALSDDKNVIIIHLIIY